MNNKEIIESKGLPYSEKLKMIPTSRNCTYPKAKDVYEILIKKYLIATLSASDYDYNFFQFIYRNFNGMYEIEKFLSDNEKNMINKLINHDNSINISKLSWIYEECFIYAWMLNLIEFPSQERQNDTKKLDRWLFIQTDEINKRNLPSKLSDIMYDKNTKKNSYDKLKLKSFDEILKKADLIQRYVWALEEMQLKKEENKSGIDYTVVYYQLIAFSKSLNWDLTQPGI